MFALCDGGTDFEGQPVVEKRGFFFPSSSAKTESEDGDVGNTVEIRVFRSKARRREQEVVYEVFGHDGKEAGGVQ